MAFSTAILRDLNILYIVKPSPSVGEGFTIRKSGRHESVASVRRKGRRLFSRNIMKLSLMF